MHSQSDRGVGELWLELKGLIPSVHRLNLVVDVGGSAVALGLGPVPGESSSGRLKSTKVPRS